MAPKLSGTDARIWELHMQGFSVTGIAALMGLPGERVRGVITDAWLADKLGKRIGKPRGGGDA